jgi:hypothetical protein
MRNCQFRNSGGDFGRIGLIIANFEGFGDQTPTDKSIDTYGGVRLAKGKKTRG